MLIKSGEFSDFAEVARKAISESEPGYERQTRLSRSSDTKLMRNILESHVLQPGTGKGFVVRKGQVIRVQQISGGQCADFNVFNLNNTHESLQVGKTRMMHGVSPVTGDLLWSKGPWERPLMAIVASNAVTDAFYPCCSPRYYNTFYGDDNRTNCQQMQEQAQQEFNLPRYCSHESFNMFMHVSIFEGGGSDITHNASKPGDFIDLYALMDVLAVVNVCGDDLSPCNNFELKPVAVEILEALDSDRERASASCQKFTPLSSCRSDEVEARPAERNPRYRPNFPFLPEVVNVPITLDIETTEKFHRIKKRDIYGNDDSASLRDIVMSWLGRRLTQ